MSASSRRNGWVGFDVAERVHGGWRYRCDGMPSMFGCGGEIVVARRWAKVGAKKASGWLVCYGLEPKPGAPGRFDDPGQWQEDHDVVLTFCPSCRVVVEARAA
jgi:hypothetical protein